MDDGIEHSRASAKHHPRRNQVCADKQKRIDYHQNEPFGKRLFEDFTHPSPPDEYLRVRYSITNTILMHVKSHPYVPITSLRAFLLQNGNLYYMCRYSCAMNSTGKSTFRMSAANSNTTFTRERR